MGMARSNFLLSICMCLAPAASAPRRGADGKVRGERQDSMDERCLSRVQRLSCHGWPPHESWGTIPSGAPKP